MRPFGCPATILNTLDHLGKFDVKADEGLFVGYSLNSKAFRVFNIRKRIVEENLHIRFSESGGQDWLFDIDALTRTMNYEPIVAGTQSNGFAEEPKKVIHALKDPSWIEAMQEELLQFKLQEVWTLVNLSNGKGAIGTKWVFGNKKDERGIVIRNKARLVAQGHTQEEMIDYDEVFALVVRIEAIRLFLAYASFKDFVVYQMDVKSAFLYEKIEEEVYVCQPLEFEDPNFPDRVYKVEKTLYGLHQAPRAWHKGDILLVQVYVDDIIFGSMRKELCNAFERLMHEKFQMSFMGELTFFLGLQEEVYVCQPPGFEDTDHLDKVYIVVKALYGLHQAPRASYETLANYLLENGFQRGKIDQTLFIKRQKGDILLVQIHVDDIIFGSTNKDLFKSFEKLIKDKFQMSSMGELTFFLGLQFWTSVAVKKVNDVTRLQALVEKKKVVVTEATIRHDLRLDDAEGVECLPNEEIFTEL
nr:retrovirus-related Pol polyprotein from transposon TNT 1-94 [Tanacetum cinerariifolium]